MHQSLILQVFADFILDRNEVTDHIGMSNHDSLRLSGGARGENYFQRIGRLNLSWAKACRRMLRDYGCELQWIYGGDFAVKNCCPFSRRQRQFCRYLGADAASEIGTRSIINGNGNYPAKRASEK